MKARQIWFAVGLSLLLVAFLFFLFRQRQQQSAVSDSQVDTLTIALNDGDEGQAIEELAKKYPEANIEIVELPYQNLREKLSQTLAATRSTYDVVMLDDPWFPELSPYLEVLTPLPNWLLEDIIPASLALGRSPYPDGDIQALAYVGNCQLLFFRSDILSTVGVESPPQTWQKVVEIGKSLRESGSSASGYCVRGKSGAPVVSDFLPVLWSFGGAVVDRKNPQIAAIGGPETAQALALYRQLVSLSPPGAAAYDYPEMLAEFVAGNAALELTWPAAVADLDRQIPKRSDGSRVWGVALPPTARTETPGTSMAGNWLLAIPTGSEDYDAAKALILWLFEKQSEAARAGNPPTRRSVYEQFIGDESFFHYPVLREALENSTPRPRTAKWAQLEEVISTQVTGVITDRTSIEDAVGAMEEEIDDILARN